MGLQTSRSSAEQMRTEPQVQGPAAVKTAFQPLNHHSKRCFSMDTYSVILHFLTVKVLRLKFLCLCNIVPASLCCSPDTIKPTSGAGASLGQPRLVVCPSCLCSVGNQIASGFLSSASICICSEMLSWLPLKLKVDKTEQMGFSSFLNIDLLLVSVRNDMKSC